MASVRNTQRFQVTSVLTALWLSTCAHGYPFAGGTGTSGDPYQVTDVNGLTAISTSQSLLSSNYVLLNDIILDPNGSYGQSVIPGYYVSGGGTGRSGGGSRLYGLSGCIDGAGHVIANLPVPLINLIEAGGEVRNLGLPNVHIDALGVSIGGLAVTNQGTIRDCYVQGELAADGLTGGLVGANAGSGTVTDCYASVSIRRAKPAGGLVGAVHDGSITRCYCAARFLDDPNETFLPLVGIATSAVGSYFLFEGASAPASGVPLTDAEMKTQGSFEGWDFYGRNVDGLQDTWFMPDDGYPLLSWQIETGLVRVPDLAGTPADQAEDILNAAGLALGEVQSDYDPSVAAGTIIATVPRTYAPVGSAVPIVSSLGPYNWSGNPGNGSATKPYEISTVGQLLCAKSTLPMIPGREYFGGAFYLLTEDLDMSARVFAQAPVATFMDILDGGGHTITNLTIAANGGNVGLFGRISSNALVANLIFHDVYISGANTEYVGALAGRNEGFVENCHASAIVGGSGAVGGLIGENEGMVTACHTEGAVTGKPGQRYVSSTTSWGSVVLQPEPLDADTAGGLIGVCKTGLISACCSEARVSASYYAQALAYGQQQDTRNIGVGGLIGQLGKRVIVGSTAGGTSTTWNPSPASQTTWYAGDVINSYATGPVSLEWSNPSPGGLYSQPSICGSLVGNVVGGEMVSCYALGSPLAGSTSEAIASYFLGMTSPVAPWVEPAPRVVGLTDQQMKQRASFVGWDFDATWTICEGLDYPRLWWEDRQCP
jgi:hypothetical protein